MVLPGTLPEARPPQQPLATRDGRVWAFGAMSIVVVICLMLRACVSIGLGSDSYAFIAMQGDS